MPRIIKTTFGEALCKVEEEFINEDAAQAGLHPEKTTAHVQDFKVQHVTYKLKDLINATDRQQDTETEQKI